MKRILIFLVLSGFCLWSAPLKLLHLTFHSGCLHEIEVVSKKLSLDLTTWFIPDLPPYFFDPLSRGCSLYNIGHDRAARIWNQHQPFFESFDVILTSDTAALSRIFLQNQWKKPLIIWICNRFDYCDGASLDCDFPDKEYYSLFSRASGQKNVRIVAYTEFEHLYARSKGIPTGNLTIKPSGAYRAEWTHSSIPENVVKSETYFLPPYHNETKFMDLCQHCTKLGVKSYCGRYNGPLDLRDFRGIIHIPYAWSNLALFENLGLGIPCFVPSQAFMRRLISQGAYFQDVPFTKAHLSTCEWYSGKYSPFIVYFDSWLDLLVKLRTYDYQGNQAKIFDLAKNHQEETFSAWKALFTSLRGENKE